MIKGNKTNPKKRIKFALCFFILLIVLMAILLVVILHNDMHLSNYDLKNTMYNAIYNDWKQANSFDDTSFLAAFEAESTFSVTAVEESEADCYIVICDVSAPNILDSLIQYQNSLTKYPSEKEINNAIVEIISSADIKTTQQTVTAYKTDAGYIVEYSEGFIDAMYGYSYNYCCTQLENFTNNLNQ